MSGQRGSRRGELARLCAELRGRDCTYREIAGRIRREHRVNARVAFRWAHGLTQAQVAERWNAQWPEQEAPKTTKQISYWETWPAAGGRRPSVDTLNKLAFLYQCSAGDLLDGQDYSHLDPAAGSLVDRSGRAVGPSPAAAAVPPPVVAGGTVSPPVLPPVVVSDAVHPAVPLTAPDPGSGSGSAPGSSEVVAAVRGLGMAGQFATRLAAQLGGLIAVADGTLGLSARQGDAACQQLVDLFTTEAHTVNRRAVFRVVGRAATAVAAGPVFTSLNLDDQERLAAAIQAPGRVDAVVLDHMERVLGHCVQQQNKGLGPQAVLDTVLAQRSLATGMLAECPAALRSRLLSVYADQSRVSGWVSVDLKDFAGAAAYYEQARTAAHEAQDTVLGTRVLCHMSQLATWQDRPRVGIDHAVAAQSWVQRTDEPLLRAWAADVAALAYARDGQQAACLAELDNAHAGFAAGHGRPSRVACYDDEGFHASVRAGCLVRLHRPTDAVQAAERSLATYDRADVRNMAFATVNLGLARLECNDLDHAATTLGQAADLAVQNRSARLAGEIKAVRARMQPWQDSSAVVQLDQRLRAYQLV